MADVTKLELFNSALRDLGQKYPLANLTDTRPEHTELEGAYNQAVNDVLAAADWNFARRRAILTGTSDATSFPPHTFSYSRPVDFLRMAWVKANAADTREITYADVASGMFSDYDTIFIEYISDDAANFDPVNWPVHFVRTVSLYLAYITAPGLARAGDDIQAKLWQQYQQQLTIAEEYEARFLVNTQIPVDREPVMRRALQFMSQSMMGSVPIETQANKLRWEMNESWDHAVRYCLEMGAWNKQSRRVRLGGGQQRMVGTSSNDSGWIEGYSLGPAGNPSDDETTWIEGYSLPPAVEPDPVPNVLPARSEFEFGYALPADFLHKIWIKADANDLYEACHQFLGCNVYTNVEPVIMEYVSMDADAVDPKQWPHTFIELVASYLALMVVPDLMIEQSGRRSGVKNTGAKESLQAIYESKLGDAKRKDAIQQQTKIIPPGRFVQARQGRYSSLRGHNRQGYHR